MHWLDEPPPEDVPYGSTEPERQASDASATAASAPDTFAPPPGVPGTSVGAPGPGTPRRRRRSGVMRAAGTALAGAAIGSMAVFFALPGYRVRAQGYAQIHTTAVSSSQQAQGSPAVSVYKTLGPSVVLVTNRQAPVDTFYGPQSQIDWGSGVIFNSAGYIVTNDHVVQNSSHVTVTLADGKTYTAKVVGGDSSTDLAVIRIHTGTPLPAAHFANSTDVVPGEVAIAIGNPLGPAFSQSVTEGIVGAVRPMLYGAPGGPPRVTSMIQTDAPINPGNSGGALADAQGDVIGITSMKVGQTGNGGLQAIGLGFAIPSNTVQHIVNQIMRYGYVKRAWLGIELNTGNTQLPTQNTTLTVAAVQPGGPSAGKLQPHDVIVSWNGQSVHNYLQLVQDINKAAPGQTVSIGVRRGGRPVTVKVVLGTEPRSLSQPSTASSQQQVPSNPSIPGSGLFPFLRPLP